MTAEHIVATSWEEFERAGWERSVDPYHTFFGPIGHAVAPTLLEWARVDAGADVLDLCCGPGYVAHAAASLGAHAHGLDIAERMIALARQLTPNGQFTVGDAEQLPYPDGSFDAVVCNFGLHHLSRPERAVAECARVLRPHGRFVTSVWDEEVNDLAIVPEAIYGAGAVVPADIPDPPTQPSYLDREDVAALLADSGVKLVTTDVIELTPAFASPEALWSGWLAAAIRTGPVLAAQRPEIRQRARERFDKAVSEITAADGSVPTRIQVVALITETRA